MNEPLTMEMIAKVVLELVSEPVEGHQEGDATSAQGQSSASVEIGGADLRLSVADLKAKLRPMAAKLQPIAREKSSLPIPFGVGGAIVSKDGLYVRALARYSVFSDKTHVRFDVIRAKEPAHDLA